MKIMAFNGSPRGNGNTRFFLETLLEPLRAGGAECEIADIALKPLRGCTACLSCRKTLDMKCAYGEADRINEWIRKMNEADAIVIGSPVYFADITAETKAFLDRTGYVASANGKSFTRKIGGAVAIARRAGSLHALGSLYNWFMINDMILAGSTYWGMSLSKDIGDGEKDEEGIKTMKRLGENIWWLLEKMNGSR